MAVANVWVPSMERATLVAAMSSGQDGCRCTYVEHVEHASKVSQEFGSLAANLLSPLLLRWGPLAVFMSWGGQKRQGLSYAFRRHVVRPSLGLELHFRGGWRCGTRAP